MPAKKCEILMQKCEIVLNAIFSTSRPANTSFHACGMQDLTRTRPSRLSFMEKKTHKVPWDLQSVSLYHQQSRFQEVRPFRKYDLALGRGMWHRVQLLAARHS